MLDIGFIRENKDKVQADSLKKGVKVDIGALLKLDEKRRAAIGEVDELRAERNEISSKMKGGKPPADLLAKAKKIKESIAKKEVVAKKVEADYNEIMILVPNVMHESVPEGKDDSENVPLRTVGEKPEFDFKVKDHETLALDLDLLDLESAAHTSGSRFYYLKNEAVLLEFALVNWLLEKYVAKGFTPVTVPTLVREHMMEATGFFPADRNEIYSVNPGEDDLFLVGTSEVTLAGLHMKKPLDELDLPKRYVGFSTCYRREAGSYGKDVKGIFRVHQFDKIEMYSYTHPDKSWEEHEYLLSIEEEIMQELEIPYQVVNICSGDLGAPAAKKYDLEAWIPSQERYRELTSCSNTTDFQTRRGGIKYRTKKGGLEYAHTLNGTAMASTRTLVALLENNQTKDGKIKLPKVLAERIGKNIIG